MKFRIDKKYIHWGFTAFAVIAASILFYYLLFHRENLSNGFHAFLAVAMPILDGLILAYLLTPILNGSYSCLEMYDYGINFLIRMI